MTNLPRTIVDAIRVTLNLGIQYLWVNSLCIPQDDADELARQLGVMDLVFSNAELVIVAAAGCDADHGLSGVSIPRTQPLELIDGDVFLTLPQEPMATIGESIWNTRAWTFQEFICTRKMLALTDAEVIWQCESGYCHEAMERFEMPVAGRPTQKTRWPVNPEGYGAVLTISHYSRRRLTYESDALRAMLGVFRRLEHTEYPVYQICGVPIFPSLLAHPSSLIERPSSGLMLGLCWTHEQSGMRRYAFPSWSWTGWKTPISDDQPECGSHLGSLSEDWTARAVHPRTNSIVDCDQDFHRFLAAFTSEDESQRSMLELAGPVLDVWLEDLQNPAKHIENVCCRLRLKKQSRGTSLILELLDQFAMAVLKRPDAHCVAIVVTTEQEKGPKYLYTLLVFREAEKDVYERIGHCRFGCETEQDWHAIAPQHIPSQRIRLR